MLNVNGKKMSKSLGNFFLPKEIIDGSSSLFTKPYSPEVVRFFMMQSHYRSTLDLTETALDASEKGLKRLLDGVAILENAETSKNSSIDVNAIVENYYNSMDDDFNAPILISHLFETVKIAYSINEKKETITQKDKAYLFEKTCVFLRDVLGIENQQSQKDDRLGLVMDMVIEMRKSARENKNWELADQIRDGLAKSGITIRDRQEDSSWE
jgi:cysteinyl-tRNA synthetase